MVTELVLRAFVPLLTGLFDLAGGSSDWLGLATLDEWMNTWGDTLAGIWEWNAWIPVNFTMIVLGALLALRMAVFGYRMLRHVWDALPLT